MTKTWIFLLAGFLLALPLTSFAEESKDTEIDEKKIYFGDPEAFKKPGVIQILKVFEAIPEYQDAKKKGKDDPEYYILMEKANQHFSKALEKVAADEKYDLIGEVGSIKIKGKKVPEITDLVIKALPK
ncbi:MAG: hypothetical protein ACYTHM_14635 [Planctomycetota bacterium]